MGQFVDALNVNERLWYAANVSDERPDAVKLHWLGLRARDEWVPRAEAEGDPDAAPSSHPVRIKPYGRETASRCPFIPSKTSYWSHRQRQSAFGSYNGDYGQPMSVAAHAAAAPEDTVMPDEPGAVSPHTVPAGIDPRLLHYIRALAERGMQVGSVRTVQQGRDEMNIGEC